MLCPDPRNTERERKGGRQTLLEPRRAHHRLVPYLLRLKVAEGIAALGILNAVRSVSVAKRSPSSFSGSVRSYTEYRCLLYPAEKRTKHRTGTAAGHIESITSKYVAPIHLVSQRSLNRACIVISGIAIAIVIATAILLFYYFAGCQTADQHFGSF